MKTALVQRSGSARLAAVAAGMLVTVTACGDSGAGAQSESGETFDVAVLTPTSGALSVLGEAMQHSAEAAVKVINEDGGVNGEPMTIEFIDSGSDAAEGAAAAQKVVTGRDLPDAIAMGAPSVITVPAAPLIAKAEVFTVTNATAPVLDDKEQFPHIFGATVTPRSHVAALAAELEGNGYSKVGFLAVDGEISQGVGDQLEESLAEAGIDIESRYVPDTSVDATPQLDSLLDTSPDVLVFDGFGPGVANLLSARLKSGTDLPAYASWNVTGDTAAHWESGNLAGMTLQAIPVMIKGDPTTESEAFTRFVDAVKAEAGGDLSQPILTYIAFYNEIILAAAAANAAESFDAEDLAAAVPELTDETAPQFIGGTGGIENYGYSGDSNFPTLPADSFLFVPAGPTEESMLVPSED